MLSWPFPLLYIVWKTDASTVNCRVSLGPRSALFVFSGVVKHRGLSRVSNSYFFGSAKGLMASTRAQDPRGINPPFGKTHTHSIEEARGAFGWVLRAVFDTAVFSST